MLFQILLPTTIDNILMEKYWIIYLAGPKQATFHYVELKKIHLACKIPTKCTFLIVIFYLWGWIDCLVTVRAWNLSYRWGNSSLIIDQCQGWTVTKHIYTQVHSSTNLRYFTWGCLFHATYKYDFNWLLINLRVHCCRWNYQTVYKAIRTISTQPNTRVNTYTLMH